MMEHKLPASLQSFRGVVAWAPQNLANHLAFCRLLRRDQTFLLIRLFDKRRNFHANLDLK